MRSIALGLAAAAAALALAGPASAAPTTRVISPNGTGTDCTMQNPCSYGWALNSSGSNAGDTVFALPGTYDLTTLAVDITHPLTVTADPAKPRPKFRNTSTNATAFTVENSAAGTMLEHLQIEAAGGGLTALQAVGRIDGSDLALGSDNRCALLAGAGSTLTDSTLTQTAKSSYDCLQTDAQSTLRGLTVIGTEGAGGYGIFVVDGGVTFEDTTVSASNALFVTGSAHGQTVVRRVTLTGTSSGIIAYSGAKATVTDSVLTGGFFPAAEAGSGSELHLRNVTANAPHGGINALKADAAYSNQQHGTIDARNVIARGGGPDVAAEVAANPASCTPPPCAPGSLTIDHSDFRTTSGPVLDGGANISGDPLFAGAGDFHLLPGSPAIDAGVSDPLNGPTDRDGHPRSQGGGVDIGAYESTPPAPAPAPAPTPVPTPGPAADTTPPLLSALRVTHRTFKVGRAATATAAGAKPGTKFRYTLSEPAKVTIKIDRRVSSRVFKKAATLTRTGRAGTNSTAFSGRVGRRALKPGTYRATLTARDAAGNRSNTVRVSFRIVRR